MLVQWPKSTEHLDIAFRVSIGHAEKQIVDVLSNDKSFFFLKSVTVKKIIPLSRKAPGRGLEPSHAERC